MDKKSEMRLKKSGMKQEALLKYLTVYPPIPRQSHGSTADEGSGGSASTKSDVNKAGPSQEKLTRAEKIQLEADRIPSVKTSTWNPFELFPDEIWDKIFGNLTDSKDLLNVINATPEWRKMYLPKMATILLEQALTIMTNDNDYAYLKQKEYIQCRLVCRSWDQSVQNFIQMHPVHFVFTLKEEEKNFGSAHEYASQYWQQSNFRFSGKDLCDFVVELEETHPPPFDRNPFLSRQITFTDVGMGAHGDRAPHIAVTFMNLQGIVSLLEKYGRHVWDCSINFRWNLTSLTWYFQMKTWIDMMQNLKVLNLEYTLEGTIQRGERMALEKEIGKNPLPELKDLIFLKTRDTPGPVFNEIIRKSKNLKQLQVILRGRGTGTRLSHYHLNLLASQNLTECQLTLVCFKDFEHFLGPTVGSWPLKKLFLHLEYENASLETQAYPRWPKWGCVFKAIEEKFGATLRELKLRLPKATHAADRKNVLEESPSYRLNLPHLKYLRVVLPNLTSFDFLLPLTSLTALVIVVAHLESDGKNAELLKQKETLKFNGNFHRLFETNVWEELPKLRDVHLHVAGQRIQKVYVGSYTSHVYDKKEMEYMYHSDSD